MNLPSGAGKYFIAIIPSSTIELEVTSLKNYFKEKYNSKASLNSPPHITLHMPFLWKEKKETLLTEALKKFATGRQAFDIELSGFGAFPPRTIFIDIKKNEALKLLQDQLFRFCKTELQLFNAQYKDLPFHPHLTLAFRDLKKDRFAAAWSDFENRLYEKSFLVEKITLLKHDGKHWHPWTSFNF